jgi:SAM-dependent methyltransferase
MIKHILKRLESSGQRAWVKTVAEMVFRMNHIVLSKIPGGKRCPVCGSRLLTLFRPVCGEELINQWGLDSDWQNLMQRREGEICVSCGASLRVRQLGHTLISWVNQPIDTTGLSVNDLVKNKKLDNLKIAEINSCGALHSYIRNLVGLHYSEFSPDEPNVRHESLMSLTYPDETFDIVLHSDTLEHVPGVEKSLSEIWRVLKKGGVSIFSVPIIRNGRRTLTRALMLDNGKIEHVLPASYHGGSMQKTNQYLVFSEFGDDFTMMIQKQGFKVKMIENDNNRTAVTFIAEK